MRSHFFAKSIVLLGIFLQSLGVTAAEKKPNFLIILADDLGFSDLGAFGGEISTPSLDALASEGIRMTNLHSTPTCSPTRAELLTGMDHHLVGFANMDELITPSQRGKPGYLGHLDDSVPTLAEHLASSGYLTLMSGKWHLGNNIEHGPHRRGYEKAFTLIEGGHNHFGKPGIPPESLGGAHYREHGKAVDIPDDFYSSDYFTDKLIEYLKTDTQRPFFAYLAFSAPHWPLHAPAELIEKYKGKYDEGWLELTKNRIKSQIRLGIVDENYQTKLPSTALNWSDMKDDKKKKYAKKMEIYAAMVERLDWNVGRVINELRKSGRLENTVVIFLSDNGAAPDSIANLAEKVPDFPAIEQGSFANWGGADSILTYGPQWAQAATAPRRLYKSVITEGGTLTPVIVRYPGFGRRGDISDAFATVRDIAPTVLEMAGSKTVSEEREALQMKGVSLQAFLSGRAKSVHSSDTYFGSELFGQRAMRRGRWKLVNVSQPNGSGTWELYDMNSSDPERTDLSKKKPLIFRQLLKAWKDYERKTGIILEEQVVSPYFVP